MTSRSRLKNSWNMGSLINRTAIVQFFKFSVVGVLNTAIDLGVLNILIRVSGIAAGFYFSLFKSVSFLAAVINSYFWNKYWTFKIVEKPKTGELFKFFSVNLVGLVINTGIASLIVNFIEAPVGISAKLWANIGALIAVGASLVWNFIGIKFVAFKR